MKKLERWRDVQGYEGLYRVSTRGRVRSMPRNTTKGGLLKPALNTRGQSYYFVVLCKDGVRKIHYVHRLVAQAFLPASTDRVVRHLDGNSHNNWFRNLAYGTDSENNLDKVRHGTHHEANKTHCPYGHEYTPENTYMRSGGRRFCRECGRQRNRFYKQGGRGKCPIT